MDEFIKFNSQTAGRDKIFRLVQYLSRILWYNLQQRKSSSVESVERFKKLDELLGLVRRILRFGRCIETFQSTFSVLSLNNTVIRLTSSLSRISNSCFMVIDHIVCLDKLRLLHGSWKIDAKRWDRWSTKFWLYSILLGLIRDGYEIYKLYCEHIRTMRVRNVRQRSQPPGGIASANSAHSNLSSTSENIQANSEESYDENCPASRCAIMEMEVEKSTREIRQRFHWSFQQVVFQYFNNLHKITAWIIEHSDITIDTTKNLFDLLIPLNSLGTIKLSPRTIGYVGVTSTILSAMPQINPMYKMIPAM